MAKDLVEASLMMVKALLFYNILPKQVSLGASKMSSLLERVRLCSCSELAQYGHGSSHTWAIRASNIDHNFQRLQLLFLPGPDDLRGAKLICQLQKIAAQCLIAMKGPGMSAYCGHGIRGRCPRGVAQPPCRTQAGCK